MTKRICLIGLLTAINVSSQLFLQFLPNFKPITSIIIIVTLYFGFKFACTLTVTTVLLSSSIFSFGTWTPFQMLSWFFIVFLTTMFAKFISKENTLFWAIFSGFMGFVFGAVVSLEQFLYTNMDGVIVYWLAGLYFDASHAAGNVVFYLCLYQPLMSVFKSSFSTS